MPYCSQDDITAEMNGADLLPFLADQGEQDIKAATVQTLLAQIIDRCGAKCDGRISPIYQTPIVPTPPCLRDACTVFVCEALWRRRLTPDEKNPFKAEAEEMRERLVKIGAGELELDANYTREYPQGVVVQTPMAMNTSGI